MPVDLKELMAGKSDEGLQLYITDAQRYTPEAIYAAISELEKRGKAITIAEHAQIIEAIERKKIEQVSTAKETPWSGNVADDSSTPILYSEMAIWGFSMFFTTLAGALLLSANLRKQQNKNGSDKLILFGVVYTVLSIVCINYIVGSAQHTTSVTLLFNGIGGMILNKFFWPRYIGDIKYRTRKFLIPLVIWIAITLLFLIPIILRHDQ